MNRIIARSEMPDAPQHADEKSGRKGRWWNYRVIEFRDGEDAWRSIHEVHYEDGVPTSYSETPAPFFWFVDDGDAAAVTLLERMREALSKVVLTKGDFAGG